MQRFSVQSLTLPAVLLAVGALAAGFLAGFGIRSEMAAMPAGPYPSAQIVQSGQTGSGGSISQGGNGGTLYPRNRVLHGILGTVVSASSSSVTVKNLATSRDITLHITASTAITDVTGAHIGSGEIAVNACVVVREGVSGTTTVARDIRIFAGSFNPCSMLSGDFPGGQGGITFPGFPSSPLLPATIATPSPSPGSPF